MSDQSEGEPQPSLEIAQTELIGFRNTVRELIGSKTPVSVKDFPKEIDGEEKVVELGVDGDKSASMRVRDSQPTGPGKEYLYEELFCVEIDGRFRPRYSQGSLVKDRYGRLMESTHASGDFGDILAATLADFQGQMMRRVLEGEPVDEFRRMTGILETLKAEQQQKKRGGPLSKFRFRKQE